MTQHLNYIIFDTDMGWVGVLGSTAGLVSITLPHSSTQEINRLLGDIISHARWSPHLFQDLMERLRAYFSGHQ